MSAPIAVVVGLLTDAEGRVLLCQRPEGRSYALQWEFPGGKVEPGEELVDALRRELREELGIEVEVGDLLYSKTSRYADSGLFAVAYYRIDAWTSPIVNHTFAAIDWVAPRAIVGRDILSGNVEFCEMLAVGAIDLAP